MPLENVRTLAFALRLADDGSEQIAPRWFALGADEKIPTGLQGTFKLARIIIIDNGAVNLVPAMQRVAVDGSVTDLGLDEDEWALLLPDSVSFNGDTPAEQVAARLAEKRWAATKPTTEEMLALMLLLPVEIQNTPALAHYL